MALNPKPSVLTETQRGKDSDEKERNHQKLEEAQNRISLEPWEGARPC